MKTKLNLHIVVLNMLIMFLDFNFSLGANMPDTKCKGKFFKKIVNASEFKKVLELHQKWLLQHRFKKITGKIKKDKRRANLCGADLTELSFKGVDLRYAILTGAIFPKNLKCVNFSGADLTYAYLSNADLSESRFTGTDLRNSKLKNAILHEAFFHDANLENANLEGAIGERATFTHAKLSNANLSQTDFRYSYFIKTSLIGANLKEAKIINSYLFLEIFSSRETTNIKDSFIDIVKKNYEKKRAKLEKTDFTGSFLSGSFFKNCNLTDANFKNADLGFADLSGMSDLTKWGTSDDVVREHHIRYLCLSTFYPKNFFSGEIGIENIDNQKANSALEKKLQKSNQKLSGVNFSYAILTNTNFSGANLDGVTFSNASVVGANFLSAQNLENIKFNTTPIGLIDVRGKLRKQGSKESDRVLTYLIKKSEINQLKEKGNKTQYFVNWLLFDFTCKWGLLPSKPIFIIFYLLIICGFINFFLLWCKSGEDIYFYIPLIVNDANGSYIETGKYLVQSVKSQIQPAISTSTSIVDSDNRMYKRLFILCYNTFRGIKICGTCKNINVGFFILFLRSFQYSLYSAFQIGWKELTVGSWFQRIQRKPYLLKSKGLIRFLSGCQSIVSAYLLALSVLTYFGHPFDW